MSGCSSVPVQDDGIAEKLPDGSVGLALSGGGSKAAPFALGVLAGLQESRSLDHIAAISSVSGGSYAALFYYTRLNEMYSDVPGAPTSIDEAFRDCRPIFPEPKKDETTSDPNYEPGLLGDQDNSYPIGKCPVLSGSPWRNYWRQGDDLRYASQIRASQALFGNYWEYRPTSASRAKATVSIGLRLFVNTIQIPGNILLNGLFDWDCDFSLAKAQYVRGIGTAYGATPSAFASKPVEDQGRARANYDALKAFSFDRLRGMHEDGASGKFAPHVPLWIINVTAGFSNSAFHLIGGKPLHPDANAFELTPYHFGSNGYGHQRWDEAKGYSPVMPIAEAVGASGAFFDAQQRSVGGKVGGPIINASLKAGNMNWGTTIPNYVLPKSEYDRAIILHRLLPWPLYLLHKRRENRSAVQIHLSDGGHTENTGIYALLRRGVRDIVYVDAAEDSHYNFGDLCTLDSELRKSTLVRNLDMNDYQLQPLCKTKHDPFQLKNRLRGPVLRGRVCAGLAGCSDADAVARLYVLKPVLNVNWKGSANYSLAEVMAGKKVAATACDADLVPPGNGYPCEILEFLSIKGNQGGPYPQHSTIRMSALSSPYLYGAYRELGRYYARALMIDANSKVTVTELLGESGQKPANSAPSIK